MNKGRSFDSSPPQRRAPLLGTPADHIADLRARDQLFDELVADYLTVATALRQSRQSDGEGDRQFWMDPLETLHALDREIKKRLSQVE